MLIWFALLIPVIAILVLLICFKKDIEPWEYCVQFFVPSSLIGICWLVGQYCETSDTEYLGSFIVSSHHEEPWNEYIHRTCSRTVSCGKDCTTTEFYDCSYVEEHPEKYYFDDSIGNTKSISRDDYYALVRQFSNEKKTGHHTGYTRSGDVFGTFFDGSRPKLEPVTTKHTYKNKVQASHNVMNFPDMSKKEAQELGLYEYADYQRFHVPAILGRCAPQECRVFDEINALLGPVKQIRVWVLIYDNKPSSIVQDQLNYWRNGNKNEFVICVGKKDNKLQWSNVFTWSESDELRIKARDKLIESYGKNVDLVKYAEWLEPEIKKGWKRKEFKDFDYLYIETPAYMIYTAYVITILSSLVLAFFHVNNEDNFFRSSSVSKCRRYTRW